MKKFILLIFALSMLTTGCAAKPVSVDGSSATAALASAESTGSNNNASASKTLEGEIKFYPTYDANYKTGGNEVFGFWFDIPNDWEAVDKSEDGSLYNIITGNDRIEINMYGVLKNGSEDDFYASLSSSSGTISDFAYRDGWVGKQITVSGNETYYVRVDGDSYMILYVNSKDDSEWMTQNAEKIKYVAMSARTTKESYGKGMGDKNTITLDDLQLGKIKLDMSYEELLKAMKQKPEKEVMEEYEGLEAKTLFFTDNTQILIVGNVVYSINVTSPEYQTPRGLKTGDSVKRLKELYGEPANKEDESHWGYTYDGYELFTVVIEDDKVVEIQIDVAM